MTVIDRQEQSQKKEKQCRDRRNPLYTSGAFTLILEVGYVMSSRTKQKICLTVIIVFSVQGISFEIESLSNKTRTFILTI